jgi:molybdenum cofactor guanylyltransferase
MGRDKAFLDWHGVPLLAHVCEVARAGTGGGPVVVVGAPGRELPTLPAWAVTVVDSVEGVGPMQGLLDGLRALPAEVELVFLASTDAPLLRPAYIAVVIDLLRAEPTLEAVVPFVRGHRHPLLAAYRSAARHRLEEGLRAGQRRAGQIFGARLRLVAEQDLLRDPRIARDDPTLVSVDDADTPEEYAALLAAAPVEPSD